MNARQAYALGDPPEISNKDVKSMTFEIAYICRCCEPL